MTIQHDATSLFLLLVVPLTVLLVGTIVGMLVTWFWTVRGKHDKAIEEAKIEAQLNVDRSDARHVKELEQARGEIKLAADTLEATRRDNAALLAHAHQLLLLRVTELEKQAAVQGQQILPLWTAAQAILVKELTHFHTPEMDALMIKLGPPFILDEDEERRLEQLVDERQQDMSVDIPESEREAAGILRYLMKRARREMEILRRIDLVVVPRSFGERRVKQVAVTVERRRQAK